MNKINLQDFSLAFLHSMRLKGAISTVEIAEFFINRIKKFDKQINSFISIYFDQAIEKAELADSKLRAKSKLDVLEGMPFAVKDIFNIQGTKTTCGSKMLANYTAPYDAGVVSNLKKYNFSLVGKTNMDEFAMGSTNENSAFAKCFNPFNLDFVPGGSSGGSAAAVAAGFCVGALGSDTGGSIRQPAGFCGVVGLKPTYGRASRYGMAAFCSSFDQAGPIARTVEDAAIILQRISGYDSNDPTSIKKDLPNWELCLNKDIKTRTIGVIDDLDLSQCSAEVRDSFNQTLALLSEQGGVKIKKFSLPLLKHVVATYYIIAMAEASSNLSRYDGVRYGLRVNAGDLSSLYEMSRDAGFGDEVKLRILMGTFVLSAGYYDAYYSKAQKVRALLTANLKEIFKQVDVIALPVAPTTAPKLSAGQADPLKMYLTDAFTVPANLSGLPAISLPCHVGANNLPIGIQFLADYCREDILLELASWVEGNIGFNRPALAI